MHSTPSQARTVNDTTPCILIVDDEPLNIKLLDIVLRKNGYRTLSATSGRPLVVVSPATSEVREVFAAEALVFTDELLGKPRVQYRYA